MRRRSLKRVFVVSVPSCEFVVYKEWDRAQVCVNAVSAASWHLWGIQPPQLGLLLLRTHSRTQSSLWYNCYFYLCLLLPKEWDSKNAMNKNVCSIFIVDSEPCRAISQRAVSSGSCKDKVWKQVTACTRKKVPPPSQNLTRYQSLLQQVWSSGKKARHLTRWVKVLLG